MKEAREQKRILMLPFGIYSLFKQADRSDGFMKILGDKDHPSYLDRSEIPILQVGMWNCFIFLYRSFFFSKFEKSSNNRNAKKVQGLQR